MAWNDDRHRIAAERRADRLRGAGRSDRLRDLAIGPRLALGDGSDMLQHLAIERAEAVEIDGNGREIDLLPGEQPLDDIDRGLDEGRRRLLDRAGEAGAQAGDVGRGKRRTYDKAAAPQEGAAA